MSEKPKTKILDYINPIKVFPALKEAYKKASESKDKSFFKKIGIFFSSFIKEMQGVKEEKKKVSAETNKAVEKGVDETMKDVRKATEFDKKFSKKEEKFYNEVRAMGVNSFESMDNQHQGYFFNAFKKISKKSGTLSFDEVGSTAAVGLMTLQQLKKKYPNQTKFKEKLISIYSISNKTKLPLNQFFNKDLLEMFQLDNDDEKLKFLGAFGIKVDPIKDGLGKYLPQIGLKGEVNKAETLFGEIGKKESFKKDDELVKFMKKYFFKSSSKTNIAKIVNVLNERKKGTDITLDVFVDLVFAIDDKDYQYIVKSLVGNTSLKVA